MWDDVQKQPAFEMEFKSQVLGVRLRRDLYVIEVKNGGLIMVGLLRCWLDGFMFIAFITRHINSTPSKQPTTNAVPSHTPRQHTQLTVHRIMCPLPLPYSIPISLPWPFTRPHPTRRSNPHPIHPQPPPKPPHKHLPHHRTRKQPSLSFPKPLRHSPLFRLHPRYPPSHLGHPFLRLSPRTPSWRRPCRHPLHSFFSSLPASLCVVRVPARGYVGCDQR